MESYELLRDGPTKFIDRLTISYLHLKSNITMYLFIYVEIHILCDI